ncbi:Hypothetical predicted protein [Podarcis lilfordi]|uniref:Uncharacterized protein n=1 Tax=Podarcis lilfordi TaxID=74358 RepID=A0AA35K2S8_9SAUR|nr:Hypothetical predicted protein [Podarcis lilfordi]
MVVCRNGFGKFSRTCCQSAYCSTCCEYFLFPISLSGENMLQQLNGTTVRDLSIKAKKN